MNKEVNRLEKESLVLKAETERTNASMAELKTDTDITMHSFKDKLHAMEITETEVYGTK